MGGLRFDNDSNACVCPNTCTPPFSLNPKSCDCECAVKCEPPFVFNADSCSCDCPGGLVPNDDMTDCVCPFEGQELDPKQGCICPGDLELNEDAGRCLCPDCPKGFTVEQNGDMCNCTCNVKCPGIFTLNEELCLCDCPPGAVFDDDLGVCRCRGDQVYIPEIGMCECKGADMVFNEDTEMCECAPCPEGYIPTVKEDSCKCICFSESCKGEETPTSS